jgi:hypothetical protein
MPNDQFISSTFCCLSPRLKLQNLVGYITRICVTLPTVHQVLENVGLLLNHTFCFTVLQTYFLLVVYSLYREQKRTTPTNIVWRVRLDNTLYENVIKHLFAVTAMLIPQLCMYVSSSCLEKKGVNRAYVSISTRYNCSKLIHQTSHQFRFFQKSQASGWPQTHATGVM